IIKSARLAETVLDSEKLDQNPAFMDPPMSLLAQGIAYARQAVRYAISLVGRGEPEEVSLDADSPAERRQAAIQSLQRQIVAERAGRSRAITIAFPSTDPELAARITNAYAKAYVADQLDASFEATEHAAIWMQGRLAELQES